jgi:serine/threonine protein kinase
MMADDPRVQQLLLELLDSQASPEVVCHSCPELLPVVRDRWLQVCRVRAELDALLPRSAEPSSPGRVLESLDRSIGLIPRVVLPGAIPNDQGMAAIEPSSPEMPSPDVRGGRYQLFGEIGRGGMGAILKGRDADLCRDLAVKVLLEVHRGKPELVRRFVEEAQIAGQLQHPGIVPVYELGTFADSRPYFTMKLVKGRTMAQALKDRSDPRDDLARFLGIFEQVCQTVAYAHAWGVIHRDLKPLNIMLGSFGQVQVMDWGLAKVLKKRSPDEPPALETPEPEASVIRTLRTSSVMDDSRAGSALGTPAYMPPEQACGDVERVDRRADVFGLGSILCEVLTGGPAYTGRSKSEVARKAMRGDTGDAQARLEGCGADGELIALARDCLAVEAEDRPREAGVVAGRIAGYLAGVQERLHEAELAETAWATREEEVRYYSAARALRPETVHELAHVLDKMGRGAEAEATFRDPVARRPVAMRHLACFGRFLNFHGKVDEARKVLERATTATRAALELRPDDVPAHLNLGDALLSLGKLEEAEVAYRAALELQPDYAKRRNHAELDHIDRQLFALNSRQTHCELNDLGRRSD